MGYNRFMFQIIFRSIILALTALIMMFFAFRLEWIFTSSLMGLLFVLQIVLLIRFLNRTNRDLANFLIHLRDQNTTIRFSESHIDKLFQGLSTELDKINQEFSDLKDSDMQKENMLNLILDRVGTGILILDEDGNTKLFNTALSKLFGLDVQNGMYLVGEKIRVILEDVTSILLGEQCIRFIRINNINRRILLALTEIKENDELLKIYSFHDIDREMTDFELQSWHGLIKVLSHEILNTLTPMSTVTDTMIDCLTISGENKEPAQINTKDIGDAVRGIKLLENRIGGLKDLVVKFREFSDIPSPTIQKVDVKSSISDIIDTFKIENPTIEIEVEIEPEKFHVSADTSLFQLVVTNIIKNAIQASSQITSPKIIIKNNIMESVDIITVQDNGDGIDPGIIDKVFLPFFTTKEEGSGIGLSLARQIMYSHNGNIEIESLEKGTKVKLIFPRKKG